jgi:hypothetical protein
LVGREFTVRKEREREFEMMFGPRGIWAELVIKAGSMGSDLILISEAEGRYQVWDRWKSHLDFERFRQSSKTEIERISGFIAREDWLIREVFLGSFYDEPGDTETGLAPA